MSDVKNISDEGGSSPSEMDILDDETGDAKPDQPDESSNEGVEETPEPEPEVKDPDEVEDEDVEDDEENDEDEVEDKPKPPPTFKAVAEKYPKFWKEFPEIRKAVIESNQFSQLFDSPNDAKEVVAKSQTFDALSEALLSHGNSLPLIENLAKNATPDSFKKFAESVLPAIHKQNPEVYMEITVPIIKKILRAAHNDGVTSNSSNLTAAAKMLTQYLFGTTKLEVLNEKPKEEVKEDPEKVDLKNRLAENLKVQEFKFFEGVKNRVEPQLKKSIDKYIRDTDKANLLNKFTRDAIVEKALDRLEKKLVKDANHMRTMGTLRDKAARSNFAGDWEPRVTTAYLGGAKNLLNSIQRQLVADALGQKPQIPGKQGSTSASTNGSKSHVPNDPKKVFKGEKRMTDTEFLDAD